MGVNKIIKMESESAIDMPVKIPFEFKDVPEGRKTGDNIVISPMTVSTWFRLKPLLILIHKEDTQAIIANKGAQLNDDLKNIIDKYDELLFEIVCIGIHNKKGNMPDWFKQVLMNSCTWEDIYILLNAILYRLGTTSFMNSITALKAVSPLEEEEMIALQKNKESWIRKAASHS